MKNLSSFILSGLFVLIFIVSSGNANAQNNKYIQKSVEAITPGGYFDSVADRLGNKYALRQIAINNAVRAGVPGIDYDGPEALDGVEPGCTSGYFQLYYDAGSGFETGAPGITPAALAARRAVLCQVLYDISQLINSPLSSSTQKVNIWVRNMGSLGPFAAVASSFFNVPSVPGISGIADNTVWMTINSGIDAYAGITSPLGTAGGTFSASSTYFHGMTAFNFSGTVAWHTDMSTTPGAGETDMYATALHEMMHALGFASMIDYDGTSRLGAGREYFTRYDQNLRTSATGSHLITNSGACSLYQWGFNTALLPASSILSPGGISSSTCTEGYFTGSVPTNSTNCAHAVYYAGGTTIPVYTSDCYERGSSLSHFEDECYVPSGFTLGAAGTATNDQYFLMANQAVLGPYSSTSNPGAMKRHPTDEERIVLCDIGYSVNTSFGSAADLNAYTYTGASVCPGIPVTGANDGITAGGSYAFSTTSSVGVYINGPLALSGAGYDLKANDHGATGIKCVEVVTGTGTTTYISGTTATGSTNIQYTPGIDDFGVQLIRYIPVNASGVEGNITYVYVYVGDGQCVATACDLMMNGGFENDIPGSYGDGGILGSSGCCAGIYPIHCWQPYSASPDLLSRDTTGTIPYVLAFPNTYFFLPSYNEDVHFPGPVYIVGSDTVHNDHAMGLIGYGHGSSGYFNAIESAQTPLSAPLIPGNSYVLRCFARMSDNTWPVPSHLQFAATGSYYPLIPVEWIMMMSLPIDLTEVCNFAIPINDNDWHVYTTTFTYSGPDPAGVLVILNATYLNADTTAIVYESYLMVDDISIQPLSADCSFSLPATMCGGIIDLNSYVSVPGGIYDWTTTGGVVTHSNMFDPIAARAAAIAAGGTGIVTVGYHYTDALGCAHSVFAETTPGISPDTITGPSCVLAGDSIALSETSTGGLWSSSTGAASVSASGMVVAVAGVSGVSPVVISYGFGGCAATKTVSIIGTPVIGISGTSGSCASQVISTAAGYDTYQWYKDGVAIPGATANVYTAGASGTYKVTCTTGSCSVTSSGISVTVTLPFTITGPSHVCIGCNITLSSTTTGPVWSNSSPAIATAAPSGTTDVIHGVATGTDTVRYTIAATGCYAQAIITVGPERLGITTVDADKQSYTLHPNPNDGNITIIQAAADDQPVQAEIYNAIGIAITRGTLLFTGGTAHLHMDSPAPGLYMLQLTDSYGAVYNLKFVVR